MHYLRIITTAVAISMLALTGCGKQGSKSETKKDTSPVLATVNGSDITQKQFDFIKGPLVAVNTEGFYDHLAAFFEEFYARKFAKPAFRVTCPFVATPAEAMSYIEEYTPSASTSKWFT